MHETLRLFVMSIAILAPVPMQTVTVPPFTSIEVPHGGHLVVRPGSTQRVTLIRGSSDYTRFDVTGGVLVIDKCFRKCPRGYRIEVEITTPSVTRVALSNGGSIETRGGFPRQGELAVDVSHGGTIDVRSMAAQRVNASVEHGGRILTVPQASLFATVTQGGIVTYWGDAQVRSAIRHGGAVTRGRADELNLPASEVGGLLLPRLPKVGHGR